MSITIEPALDQAVAFGQTDWEATSTAEIAIVSDGDPGDEVQTALTLVITCVAVGIEPEGFMERMERRWRARRRSSGFDAGDFPPWVEASDRPRAARSLEIAEAISAQTGIAFAKSHPTEVAISLVGYQILGLEADQLDEAFPSLNELCVEMVLRHPAIPPELAEQVASRLQTFPLPVLGSPPSAWQGIKDLGLSGGYVAALGLLLESGQPVLAIVTGTTAVAVYIFRPSAEVLRQNLADRLTRRLKIEEGPAAGPAELPPAGSS